MECSLSRLILLLLATLSAGLGCGDRSSPLVAADDPSPMCGEPAILLEGDFDIRSMADLRRLAPADGECFRLEGDLQIVMIEGLRDLALIAGLTEVTGNLSVGLNPDLQSIASLSALRRLDGGLSLFSNSSLVSLEGLQNLVHVGGHVSAVWASYRTSPSWIWPVFRESPRRETP